MSQEDGRADGGVVDIAVSVVGEDVLVVVAGELDLASVRTASARIDPLLAGGPYDQVLVDAGGLTFCDSSGIQFFLRLAARLRARGGVRFLRTSEPLQQVLDMTGAGEAFGPPG